MRTAAAGALVLLLGGSVVYAGPASGGRHCDWNRIGGLSPGALVTVLMDQPGFHRGYFVSATRDELTLLSVPITVPDDGRRSLVEIITRHQPYLRFVETPGGITHEKVRLEPGGLFYASHRVADLKDVLHSIPQTEIREALVRSRGFGAGVFLGAGVGVLLGWIASIYYGERGDENVAVVSMIGLPIVGGAARYRLFPHDPWKTVYRRYTP